MNKRQAKHLFKKYINNECTEEEKELLENYLESFQDKSLFLKNINYDNDIKSKVWLQIESEIKEEKQIAKYPFKNYLKYAAILIVMISISVWFLNDKKTIKEPAIVISEEAIIITKLL